MLDPYSVLGVSRNATDDIKPVKAASIYTVAILPVTLFMGLIGLLVTAATGNSVSWYSRLISIHICT